jgi:hypothetical protein
MIARYLGLTMSAEPALADAFALVALRHAVEPEIRSATKLYTAWCHEHIGALRSAIDRYGATRTGDGERLRRALFRGRRLGLFGLMRDFHDLITLAASVHACWIALHQAAREYRDLDLTARCGDCERQTMRQIAWLEMKLRQSAPQALTVPSNTIRGVIASIPSVSQLAAVADLARGPLLRRISPMVITAGAIAFLMAVALPRGLARAGGRSGRTTRSYRLAPAASANSSKRQPRALSLAAGLFRSAAE